MPSTDPDQSIWLRAQHGEQSAYDMLRRKYRPLVRGEVRKRLHCVGADDLEDIEQCVWVAAYKALPGFRGACLFSTWLAAIAKNVVFEWIRKQRSDRARVEAVTADMRDATDGFSEASVTENLTIREALKRLSEPEREAIYFCVVKQLTHEEAAERLGAPLGTLKSRVRAGLRKLQSTMISCEEGSG